MRTSITRYFYGDYGDKEAAANDTNGTTGASAPSAASNPVQVWPLWEVFIRSRQGLDHKHAGSLHAADAAMAIANARDVYTRRQEGISIWVVQSNHIHASNAEEAGSLYDPAADKIYRYPGFYELPEEVKQM